MGNRHYDANRLHFHLGTNLGTSGVLSKEHSPPVFCLKYFVDLILSGKIPLKDLSGE